MYKVVYGLSTELTAEFQGRYDFKYFELIPCRRSDRDDRYGISRFMLSLNQEGADERNAVELGKRKAVLYSAWLTLLTRIPTKIMMQSMGRLVTTFPGNAVVATPGWESNLPDTLDLILEIANGGTVNVPRPNLAEIEEFINSYAIPSDYLELTESAMSLGEDQGRLFFNACQSYQVAMNLWSEYSALSLACLVVAVEAMTKQHSMICETTGEKCRFRTDASLQFKTFIEDNLGNYLRDEDRELLRKVIGERRRILHSAATGGWQLSFPMYPTDYQDPSVNRELTELIDLKGRLETLVSSALIEWLRKQPRRNTPMLI